MTLYIGDKISTAVKVPCEACATNDLLGIDPEDPTKGVWKKAGTDNIADAAITVVKLAPGILNPSPDNILQDGGLEDVSAPDNSATWKGRAGQMTGQAARITSNHFSGQSGWEFVLDAAEQFKVDHMVKYEAGAGEKFLADLWYMHVGSAVAGSSVAIRIQAYAADKQTTVGAETVVVGTGSSTSWAKSSAAYTVPASAYYIRVIVDATNAGASTATIRIDNIVLRRALHGQGLEDSSVVASTKLADGSINSAKIAGDQIAPKHVLENVEWGEFPQLNKQFAASTDGAGAPPDGWSMVTGVWNTDAQMAGSAGLSAPSALRLNATSELTKLDSDYFPVEEGGAYAFGAQWKASGTGVQFDLVIWWFDQTKSNISVETAIDWNGGTATSFRRDVYGTRAPSSARYAKIRLAKVTTHSESITVDRVIAERTLPTFSVSRNSAQSIPTSGTKVQFNSTDWDDFFQDGTYGWDSTNYTYTVPVSGIWEFKAGLLITNADSGRRLFAYLTNSGGGSIRYLFYIHSSGTSYLGSSGSVLVKATRGDTFSVWARCDGVAENLDANVLGNYFQGRLIR